ncbi:insulin receptor substrate 1-B-like [Scleropages formosus]|uniref:Insulin receptor substrate 1-B-like n=1 Tax=Scleropages formosus TaxID=113540 RepID=A0A0P7YIS1_SCLFO|nr:insulin receptor substrate 1-B-like [Scleropages formosus]
MHKMASPCAEQGCFSDVRKVGYLRKPKSMHKRFFVLRTASASGPSRLEYYENEKKWRHKSAAPKRSIPLESCFNINKRADSKNKYLVALYTKDEYFAIAADSEQEQDAWYQALVSLHNRGKVHERSGGPIAGEDYGELTPGPAFREVWQVILKPKGLGQIKNLVGIYRLCLTNKTISFVKLNSDAAAVVLQLMNIRRCGHSENYFFIEVGRSAVTGPGEFWMQVDDSVVAQNMHETILEAMKAMSEDFRPRSKSQSSSNCSNPISVPLRRHHHNNPPPSQVGLGRRSRAESVTASSPAGQGKHSNSFRVRASSDGEGTMSRPASVDGSPGSPAAARIHSHRPRGTSRLHPPLNHSRSIPMPSARCSPSATSPVSLSSSSTSGHGSTSDCLYPRRSSASVSGSPSDGGFISSDEYGSSPCDFRGSFRSVTPDSLGHTPPAREEELSNYMSMDTPGLQLNGPGRVQSRCTPSFLEEPELEKGFRKRTHSSGTSPPTVCHQNTPPQSSTESYTVMMPVQQCARMPVHRQSAFIATQSYPEEGLDLQLESSRAGHKDDGYMPMSPGVAPVPNKSDDYMPMSPKSVSAPQQIINPRPHPRVDSNGYMMMSPSGSCSPDTNYSKIWTNGANPKLSVESSEGKTSCGDYINMSPASCSTTSTPPDCYFNSVDEPRKPLQSYFSLPRSFRHGQRKNEQNPVRLSVSSGRLAYGDSSSSSTSSDSLGGQGGGQPAVKPKKPDTLPRARESPFLPEPKSPGEYVNIEFNDKSFSASLASLFSPVFLDGSSEGLEQQPSEYMNMDLGGLGRKPNSTSKSSASTDNCAMVATPPPSAVDCEGLQSCDYVSMQLGPSCVSHSEEQGILNYSEMSGSAHKVPPRSMSPNRDPAVLNGCPGLMSQMSGLSAFSRVNSIPNHNQGARVIRVDPQGRRRHSSETFSSTSMASGVTTPPSMEDVKRHSSASFENVWLKPGEPAGSGKRGLPAGTLPSFQNGLNYIDLDLLKDQNPVEWNSLQAKPLNPQNGSNSDDLSTYASITFQKQDDVRNEETKVIVTSKFLTSTSPIHRPGEERMERDP